MPPALLQTPLLSPPPLCLGGVLTGGGFMVQGESYSLQGRNCSSICVTQQLSCPPGRRLHSHVAKQTKQHW
jgi:hypothetical protein